MTYIHSIASQMAVDAGAGVLYRVRENREAARQGKQAYDVFLKHWNQKRGKHVLTLVSTLVLS